MNDIQEKKKGLGCFSILGLMLITVLISVGITVWIINSYVFQKRFDPVELSQKEEHILNQKLKWFDGFVPPKHTTSSSTESQTTALTPEKYSEEGAERVVELSERELNALLAKNTDLSDKLAIDLSDDLLSAKLLIPMAPDFPIIGGQTIKVSVGIELAFKDSRPIIILRGVSLMGVPVPNAWLGGLKNIDLIQEFGQDEGFWRAFSDGVEDMHAEEGRFKIKLKE